MHIFVLKYCDIVQKTNFRERGHPLTTLGVRKIESQPIMWRCLCDATFSRFDTIPACDRQTDTQTHDDG